MSVRKALPSSFNFKRLTHPTKKQQGKLACLPRKILRTIFTEIKHPRDQVAFMLSCKRIARRTSSIKLNEKLISVQGEGRKYFMMPFAHRDLLEALRKWRFINSDLRFCNCCVRYLPKIRIWKTVDGRAICDLPSVDWMWAISQWQRGVAPCPTCQVEFGSADDEWLQAWPEGFARGALIRQKTPTKIQRLYFESNAETITDT